MTKFKKKINKNDTKNVNKPRGKPTKPRDPKLCECNNLIKSKKKLMQYNSQTNSILKDKTRKKNQCKKI